MNLPLAAHAQPSGSTVRQVGVLPALSAQAADHDMRDLADRLHELQNWLADDLQAVEADLVSLQGPGPAPHAALNLLKAGGKRLRPLCVLLSSRMGQPETNSNEAARLLASSVELVHAATLLHDDVVDLADLRRGRSTARVLHGNPISIFAGDWTLVEALRRVVQSGYADLVPHALSTIEEMILAEVEQVERARDLSSDREGYLRVIDGKTAALFRWAMRAGARAGNCSSEMQAALLAYATELGLAFQLSDDLLDVEGDADRTGKLPFADLAEGRITLPLALLLERRPDLRPLVVELRETTLQPGGWQTQQAQRSCWLVKQALHDSGALQEARAITDAHAQAAAACLQSLPTSSELQALVEIAATLALRQA